MFNDFYGLTGRPFQLTPDPAFYFESLTHRKAMSYLSYGLAQGEGFVVITGEVGAGKSTLVAYLMSTIDPSRLTAAQVVTSKLDGEELVHVVAQAFGLMVEGHDKASALGAIETFLHEEARAGRRCLLVVDESQNLSIEALEELRMLSNFQLGSHPLLQTLLLGQPEFREQLQQSPRLEQLRQRVIAAHHLDAMEPNEVQPYIEHRMKCVGWEGNPAFDQRVFAEIHAATGGVPRRINQIANRLLLLGAVEQRTRIDGAMLSQVLTELMADGALALARRAAPGDAAAMEAAPVAAMPAEAASFAQPAPSHAAEAEWGTAGWPADEVPEPAHAAVAAPAVAAEELADVLAERDVQIAELQQAVIELSQAVDGLAAAQEPEEQAPPPPSASLEEVAALTDRVAALEARLIEQDRTIRHTLSMLIEWIEGEDDRAAA